jgi:hypothetical protein
MKNTNKVSKIPVLGLAVIAAIAFTLALTACDFLSNNDDDGKGPGKVTISGTPKVGEKITAKISGEYLSGPRWESSDNGVDNWQDWISKYNSTDTSDFTNNKVMTIPSSEEGKFIRAWIYLNWSYDSAVYSNIIGPVQP